MNKREFLVFFVLWLIFPLISLFSWGKPGYAFIGGISFCFSFIVPIFLLLAVCEPKIKKWLDDGDK